MKVQFIGAIGLITRDRIGGRRLFTEDLALPLKHLKGTDFVFSEKLPGSRYFGVWPLSEAAQTCLGRKHWPRNRIVPQAFVEFEVANPGQVVAAARELRSKGISLLHDARKDPWGQTVVRFQTEDGLIVGISYVPWMHARPRSRVRRRRSARRR